MKLRLYPDRAQFLEYSKRGNLIPVCLEILADSETPISALAKIRQSNGKSTLFLLESVEGGERWGRYSFLGASAQSRVRMFRDIIQVEDPSSSRDIAHHGDPLSVFRQLMAHYQPVSLPELPRFWGGMVGYLTYEMVSFFEDIPHTLSEEEPLANFLVTDHLFIFDNVRHTLTLVTHVFLNEEKDPGEAYNEALLRLESMRSLLAQPTRVPENPAIPSNPTKIQAYLDEETFRSQVTRIKDYIYDGDVIQTVLSQPFLCDSPPDPWWLYRAQRYINPSPYMFFLQLDGMVLVGSSPETMVRLENGVATLRPIAGTRHRGASEQEDRQLADELLQDPKERAEHLMLVDLGRNDLGRVAEIGTVQVTDLMVVERYSHVMHLVSNISCDLATDYDAWDLLKATFPAGTLTGAPKVRAMEIIAELEKKPRGPYGGAVGYVSFTGNMDLAITIRTACIRNHNLTVQAGAGIVADSDPERERQETVNKAMAIQRALQLIQPGLE
jgi:anthranilate synthase component 1